MPLCPRCQNTLAADAQYCSACGARLTEHDDGPDGNQDSLAAEIRSLLAVDRKIAAIKLYRERIGCGLAEAKAAVEQIGRGETPIDEAAREAPVVNDLDKQVLELMIAGQKIAAIKLVRERTGCGLKDAKDAVETLGARHGIVTARNGCLGAAAVLFAAMLRAAAWFIWLRG